MKTPVSRIAPGKVISYWGEPCIVLEHRKEGTLLVTAEAIWRTFGKTNNFENEGSSLWVHLNGSKEYGTVECRVAPLTLDELRKYHGILPNPESWEWSVPPWSTPCVDDDHTWVPD